MICREWQRKIPVFLNGKMPLKQQEQFIAHVHICKDCHEELEIMYMLAEGLKELENGGDDSFNFKRMLDKKLKTAWQKCERYKRFIRIKGFIFCSMYTMTAIGVIIQILQWI